MLQDVSRYCLYVKNHLYKPSKSWVMFAEKSFTEITKRMMLLFFVCDANRRNIFIHVVKSMFLIPPTAKTCFSREELIFSYSFRNLSPEK